MESTRHQGWIVCAALLWPILTLTATAATTNSWISPTSGDWGNGANWSSNQPPDLSFTDIVIGNAVNKIVTIGAATASTNLAINKLTLAAPGGSTNTLQLLDVTTNRPLQLSDGNFTIDRGGMLTIANSAITVTNIAQFNILGGNATMDSGLIDCSTADLMRVGRGTGNKAGLTINGGTVYGTQLQIGQDSAQGTLTITNGLVQLSSFLSLGYNTSGSTGIVSISGGRLQVTNDETKIGERGVGQMTVSGGSAEFACLSLGSLPGAEGVVSVTGGQLIVQPRTIVDTTRIGDAGSGQLYISGGAVILMSELILADNGGGIGFNGSAIVSITGGQLVATNDLTSIGKYGIGEMTISNATVLLTNVSVGRHDGAIGTLALQPNALLSLKDDLSIGRFTNAMGTVLLTGGQLLIANDTIWVGREGTGQMTISNGAVQVRSMLVAVSTVVTNPPVVTNAPIGAFAMAGGSLQITSNLFVGSPLISTGQVMMTGGNASITNNSGSGVMNVSSGTFILNGGTLTADNLRLTNSTGQFVFNGGTLETKATTVANSLAFVVGDGTNAATLRLLGGTHSFANGLIISSNATLTGCGTVIGPVINNGTISTNCATVPTIVSVTRTGTTASISFTTVTGQNYTVEYKNMVNDTTWTPLLPVIPGTGAVITKNDTSAAVPTRFYRVRTQ